MPDDHSEVVPLLPIPNRTVKRLSADDSAHSRVKVGHRQASIMQTAPPRNRWGFLFWAFDFCFGRSISVPISFGLLQVLKRMRPANSS
jgi:hypothetical protein